MSIICPLCNSVIEEGESVCRACGYHINEDLVDSPKKKDESNQKNNGLIIALILVLILGGLGFGIVSIIENYHEKIEAQKKEQQELLYKNDVEELSRLAYEYMLNKDPSFEKTVFDLAKLKSTSVTQEFELLHSKYEKEKHTIIARAVAALVNHNIEAYNHIKEVSLQRYFNNNNEEFRHAADKYMDEHNITLERETTPPPKPAFKRQDNENFENSENENVDENSDENIEE